MKLSEILRKALEKFGPNGERWVRRNASGPVEFCSLGALPLSTDAFFRARMCLREAIATDFISRWNDNAESFDVIRAGFERAIALAEKEER